MSETWHIIRDEAIEIASKERILSKILTEYVFERESFEDALSWRLSVGWPKGRFLPMT